MVTLKLSGDNANKVFSVSRNTTDYKSLSLGKTTATFQVIQGRIFHYAEKMLQMKIYL